MNAGDEDQDQGGGGEAKARVDAEASKDDHGDKACEDRSHETLARKRSRRKIPSSSNHGVVDFVLPSSSNSNEEGDDGAARDVSTSSKYKKSGSSNPPLSKRTTTKTLTYKRSMSSATQATHYDTNLLKRAVSDAGRWAYGILLVEVWALSDDQTYLYRPENGFWIDPVYHGPRCHRGHHCQICRLVDPSHPQYVEPRNQTPGQGLPGVLWSEVARSWSKSFRETLAGKILGSHGSSNSVNPHKASGSSSQNSFLVPNAIRLSTSHFSSHIVWRSIPQLESDPDQPWNPRLKLLATLGLGLAAAVPFNLHGDQGIVIYMARDSVDRVRLQSESNEAYLVSATDLIAAAYALRGPRQQVVKDRHGELSSALHRVRHKLLELKRQGLDLKEYVDKNAGGSDAAGAVPAASSDDGLRRRWPRAAMKAVHQTTKSVTAAFATSLRKAKGAGAPIPPVYSWRQSLVTFFGSFATLLAVTALSDRLQNLWGPDYGMVLGPFGASMTLLYGLTAAPASQPRNVFLGQVVSMTIAVSVSYADMMPVWLRQSLGAAVAIAAMVKLGVTHPPAGATALILSTTASNTQRHSWGNMAASLVGNVIAVAMATVINNASNKRQYPIYWGFSWEELTRPLTWTSSALQRGTVLVVAAVCRCCRPHPRGRANHPPPQHNPRRAGSPASRLRPSRRVGLQEDLEEGSA